MERILVRRTGALGDVILATPVLRRMRRESPGAAIAVQTAYPDVFRDSPDGLMTVAPGPLPYAWTPEGGLSRFVDLDLAYERRPRAHVVEAYMEEAFGDPGELRDRQQSMAYRPPRAWPSARPVVAVHAAKAGWGNRTLPEATWREAIRLMAEGGLFPVLVGTSRDALPGAGAALHSTDILAQTGFLSRAACFVGSDSALLHAAGATGVPIVCAFTCALPETRLPWRDGALGGGCTALVAAVDCAGCLSRREPPVTAETCERGDNACVRSVAARDIAGAALAAASRHRERA